MKILAWPARRNRRKNPFNFLLSEALAAEGCEVVELDRRNSLFGHFDVFHIHWPQSEATGTPLRASAKSALLLLRLLLQRLNGARIVWTVHNINAHDQNNPRLERALMQLVARLVHGAIFLTAASRKAAYAELPALASKPFAVIPHGLYGRRSDKSREEARAAFGLDPVAGMAGFLGDIRPYKGLDLLLDAFEATPPGQTTLFVAGAFADRDYGAVMRRRIAELAADGHSVVLREERLDDEVLVDAIRASDAVALPYREIWNSGLAVLVVENGGRLIASDAPLFLELQGELGAERVHIAEGSLTAEALIAAVDQKADHDPRRIDAFCAARAWDRIGRDTVAFYRRLGAIGQRLNRAEATEGTT
jgi:glycosyltransferase involved in cell wall biosynthesis